MKCQLILSSASTLEVQLIEGKKKSNLVMVKEVNYEIVSGAGVFFKKVPYFLFFHVLLYKFYHN